MIATSPTSQNWKDNIPVQFGLSSFLASGFWDADSSSRNRSMLASLVVLVGPGLGGYFKMWIWDLDISALTILPLAPGTHPRAEPGPVPRRQSRAGFPIRTYPFPHFPFSLRLSLSFSCLFYRLAFDHARALSHSLLMRRRIHMVSVCRIDLQV
jgi:hypothetical protein